MTAKPTTQPLPSASAASKAVVRGRSNPTRRQQEFRKELEQLVAQVEELRLLMGLPSSQVEVDSDG